MSGISVFLNVSDIEASVDFYRQLGFKVRDRHEGDDGTLHYATLAMGDAYIELGDIEANDDPEFQEWVSTPLGAGVLIHVVVDGPDQVDAVHDRARELGATIETPPEDRPYGRAFTLNDPDGYVITFLKPSE